MCQIFQIAEGIYVNLMQELLFGACAHQPKGMFTCRRFIVDISATEKQIQHMWMLLLCAYTVHIYVHVVYEYTLKCLQMSDGAKAVQTFFCHSKCNTWFKIIRAKSMVLSCNTRHSCIYGQTMCFNNKLKGLLSGGWTPVIKHWCSILIQWVLENSIDGNTLLANSFALDRRNLSLQCQLKVATLEANVWPL